MRDRIERFVLLPFSMGCVSESSIAVGDQFPSSRSKRNSNSIPTSIPEDDKEEEEEYEDDEESMSEENLKSSLNILAAPKFQKLFKNFKNISQLFKDDDDDDDDEMEEEEEEDMGMEIGFPTDVKHVTHIGIDGSTTSILSKGWDDLKQPEFSPPPSVLFTPSDTTTAENLNLKGSSEIAYA